MRVAGVMVLAAAALLGATSGAAQGEMGGNRWVRQVLNGLAKAHHSLVRSGFERVPVEHAGMLNTDESDAFSVALESTAHYAVVGVCDGDCAALSILLYNESDYEVAADRTSGAGAIVQIRPRVPGRFRVKVVMAECRLNPCWYAVAVYRKTAEGERRD